MSLVVTLTGTGTPLPHPRRAGAGTLVRAGGHALQFDAGRGTTLRLAEAGIGPAELSALFLTHHHSDHCVALPDVVMTRWVLRAPQLTVVAPDGALTDFGRRLLDLWDADIAIRREVTGRGPVAYNWRAFDAAEEPRVVWEADGVEVRSVLVAHEPVDPAVAYRVDSGGQSVVISGDTRVCEAVEALASGADVLVHEVCLPSALPAHADRSIVDYHADAQALGAMAQRAGVGTLVLTHLLPAPETAADEDAYTAAVRAGGFIGEVVVGQDLTTVAPVALEAAP